MYSNSGLIFYFAQKTKHLLFTLREYLLLKLVKMITPINSEI